MGMGLEHSKDETAKQYPSLRKLNNLKYVTRLIENQIVIPFLLQVLKEPPGYDIYKLTKMGCAVLATCIIKLYI